ncbi:MAG TPA: pirin family protein [Casimicrobiaceae bacterium]|jgi:redox-sensitive bicupin YhaK (pirin superfamily)|nr:pirin family protein [Casimicrobiaceae bacterium]
MIELVIEERRRHISSFEVGRVLPFAKRRMVGPFIFLDHMGPVDLPKGLPRAADVLPHPHIGLSTVTYLFAGEIMHRDSTGVEQAIRAGEMNWMIAGSGITHSERFEQARRQGGPLHALQSWVALPNGEEEITPAFAHHEGDDLPVHRDRGVWLRLLAGEAFGLRAAVKTHSPLFYVHVALEVGASISLPREYAERAAFLVSGAAEVDGRTIAARQMAVFARGAEAVVVATAPSVLMLLGGTPVGERFIEWNFVSSSKERIAQAKADWRAGRMKLPDLDNAEFTPLPADPAPSAGAMS